MADKSATAQVDALNKIAALVGAQLEGLQLFNKNPVAVPQPPPVHQIAFGLSIPFPKPMIIKTGDIMENFKFFQLQWNNYLVASGTNTKSEEVKKSTLLAAIGDDCLKLYQNMSLTESDHESEKTLLAAIGCHLTPVVNKRYERAMFNFATQKPKEGFVAYLIRLRGLIKNCQFGELEEDLLVDKIICSIRDASLRQQLWMDKDITLELVIEKCQTKEIALKQMENINQESKKSPKLKEPKQKPKAQNKNKKADSPSIPPGKNKVIHHHHHQTPQKTVTVIQNNIDAVAGQNPRIARERKCQMCGILKKGAEHDLNKNLCPANGVICTKCGNKNHLTSMCKLNVNFAENLVTAKK